jgi:hypothetical protein
MVPSTSFGLNWPIAADDIMTARPGNRPSWCGDWQFGLIKIRVAELARDLSAICSEFDRLVVAQPSPLLAPKCLTPTMMHRTTALRHTRL